MTDPRKISINNYSYSLPEERIAAFPLPERDASALLIYKNGKISQDIYKNIADYIPEESILVFNNTKVVEARLLFQKPTGGIIEIFCLEPADEFTPVTTAMTQQGKIRYHCLIGGASKWKKGQILEKKISTEIGVIVLTAQYIERRNDNFIIALDWSPDELSFAEILHYCGVIPLPPYIKRKPVALDAERYQTLYAVKEGSVAAPTAGLHFTTHVTEKLKQKKIDAAYITLHIGAGTFKPVKTTILQDHEMHAEFIDVSIETIEKIASHLTSKIIAVGTTSLRTLESLYWLGVKTAEKISEEPFELSQWEAYQLSLKSIPVQKAFNALLNSMKKNKQDRLIAKTQLLIAPGYSFKVVDALITNFHQSQSTLLLLVAAFINDKSADEKQEWRKIYDYALQHGFRFLSYGDGSLLWRR